jgi:hypothetical protein
MGTSLLPVLKALQYVVLLYNHGQLLMLLAYYVKLILLRHFF